MFYVLLGTIALMALWLVLLYNQLVRLRNSVRSSWSDIDVLLKKRYDVVGNLVETVKGYARHEQGTLVGVTEARSRGMQAQGPAEKAQAENMIRETLKSLFAVAESYPDLKANENFLALQQQLTELENQVEFARRYYNAVVRDYNTLTESFPSNMVASQFAFKPETFFELATTAEREAPKVAFS